VIGSKSSLLLKGIDARKTEEFCGFNCSEEHWGLWRVVGVIMVTSIQMRIYGNMRFVVIVRRLDS
jgi:hypothetical protein